MSDIKLNTYIEWTAEDRAKGECPVPAGSDVTVWFSDGNTNRDESPEDWMWERESPCITAYLVHSVPREPMVAWGIVDGISHGSWHETKECAEKTVAQFGGRVVKLVEELG